MNSLQRYDEFLQSKAPTVLREKIGYEKLNPGLWAFQRVIVERALDAGRYCIFADCGLGKTLMQLAWAEHVPGRVLIFTPLAVAFQTVQEGKRFGIESSVVTNMDDVTGKISVTNYQKLQHFDLSSFNGIVLDESSILKSFTGAFRTAIIQQTKTHQYKLACTATPSPNDFMELGNHAEFMGAMTSKEMLSMFFVHDGGSTQNWRLKGHATDAFWRWVMSWAVMIRTPSDMGFNDEGFVLSKLNYETHRVDCDYVGEQLLPVSNVGLREKRQLARASLKSRADKAIDLAMNNNNQWLIWCELNDESRYIASKITDAVEVKGGDSDEHKRDALLGFANGDVRVLVTKPKIAGFGMNWQNCWQMIFVGLSDSYEALYQATRRCWRYGQTQDVTAYIITTDQDIFTLRNVMRKEKDHKEMQQRMGNIAAEIQNESVNLFSQYNMDDMRQGQDWTVYHGDCVKILAQLEPGSIDYSIFSPPFSSLYTYSNNVADMGNSLTHEQFTEHFGFLIGELYRVIKPGRLVSIHCMLLPLQKARDGDIGLIDFRGEIIRNMVKCGFLHHSEVVIWKDPVTQMQRTKALGLLHKQIKKDSSFSRQGLADYVVTFRKPGDNAGPIKHDSDVFPVSLWQQWASPVWMDINPSDTLQRTSAREDNDERHIAPLQLEVIKRCLALWSNPHDLVLSPFMGIGSEGVESLKWQRRFIGMELKRSYFDEAVRNLDAQTKNNNQLEMFQ